MCVFLERLPVLLMFVARQVVRAINKDGKEEERTIPYTLVAPAILACPPDDETGWQAFGDQNPMSTIEGQRVLYCKDGLRVDPQKYGQTDARNHCFAFFGLFVLAYMFCVLMCILVVSLSGVTLFHRVIAVIVSRVSYPWCVTASMTIPGCPCSSPIP